jgi:FixJ family two-component response regulator
MGGIRLNVGCIDERRRPRELEHMRTLQDAIERALQDLPEHALAALIEKKLTAQGVTLSERQRKRLTRKLMQGNRDNIRLWNWRL